MTKHIVYIAVSLDGKIARLDGSVDWLDPFNETGEEYGYSAFLDSVDAVVMGARTYEKTLSFGAWPYMDKATFVLTHTTHVKPAGASIEFSEGTPKDVIDGLLHRGIHILWVMGGGDVISTMLRDHLIDELRIFVVPVILGEGVPLFQNPGEHKLHLYSSKAFASGIVELSYVIQYTPSVIG